jgi:hypothetical protein
VRPEEEGAMPQGSLLREITNRVEGIVKKKAGGAAVSVGLVDSVRQDGTVVVRHEGKAVVARMATEEPVLPGEAAWVGKTTTGEYVVHGGHH